MLKTTYKTRNARRRMDELRKIEADGATLMRAYENLTHTERHASAC
jgi:hypothetical protein